MVFQSYHLLDDLTVAENIDLPLSYKNLPAKERQGMVADILDRFQIVAKKDLFPIAAVRRAATTGGHCARRRACARAAAGRRADRQPALNAGARDHGTLLPAQRAGTTIVQVTHSEENARYSKRIVELRDGWLTRDEALACTEQRRLAPSEPFSN